MDIRARHFGSVSALQSGQRMVDIGALIRRLILFDLCILESSLLREIPTLLKVFGYDGVMRLFDEPGFEIISGAMTAGSIGQNSVVNLTAQRGGVLPLGSYHIACVTHVDPPDAPFAASLKHVEGPGLNHQRRKRLKRRLLDKIRMHPAGAGDAGVDDHLQKLKNTPEFLGPTIRRAVSKALGPEPRTRFDSVSRCSTTRATSRSRPTSNRNSVWTSLLHTSWWSGSSSELRPCISV